jgi:hypothetical protein
LSTLLGNSLSKRFSTTIGLAIVHPCKPAPKFDQVFGQTGVEG